MITFLKTKRDLLISIDSLAEMPVVPVAEIFSEPAKSTSYNLLVTTLSRFEGSTVSIVTVKIAWDLEEAWLRLCEATILFLIPAWNNCIIS